MSYSALGLADAQGTHNRTNAPRSTSARGLHYACQCDVGAMLTYIAQTSATQTYMMQTYRMQTDRVQTNIAQTYVMQTYTNSHLPPRTCHVRARSAFDGGLEVPDRL